jgi:hypothetical protein
MLGVSRSATGIGQERVPTTGGIVAAQPWRLTPSLGRAERSDHQIEQTRLWLSTAESVEAEAWC